jgi:hypothetical protein
MWQFADLQFADDIFLAICGFANPIIVCGLKTSTNKQINNFSSYKYKLQIQITTFCFWESFETDLHGIS